MSSIETLNNFLHFWITAMALLVIIPRIFYLPGTIILLIKAAWCIWVNMICVNDVHNNKCFSTDKINLIIICFHGNIKPYYSYQSITYLTFMLCRQIGGKKFHFSKIGCKTLCIRVWFKPQTVDKYHYYYLKLEDTILY